MAAVEAGADRVHVTAMGLGERAGNTATEQLLVNLRMQGLDDRDLTALPDYVEAVAEATGVPIPHDAPVVHPAVTPGCRLLVDAFGPTYLATLPFQFGQQVTYTIALPEFLDPMTLYFQDWIFDGNTFEGTQRLEVPLVK